jgi:rod shape-determining protein MreB
VEEACLSAGARQAYLIEEPMAAAIGAGPARRRADRATWSSTSAAGPPRSPSSRSAASSSRSPIRVGGDELDESIINYVKKEYKLLIGQQTAEEVKLEIGSAYPLEEEVQAEIRGRDLGLGLPKTVVLTSEEVRAALEEPLVQIIDAIKETLDRTPPELASDIMDRGIMLAGGGSLLQGLDERLRDETQMPATAPNPRSRAWRWARGARSRSSRRSTAPTAISAPGASAGSWKTAGTTGTIRAGRETPARFEV